jgi:hypothetical protein
MVGSYPKGCRRDRKREKRGSPGNQAGKGFERDQIYGDGPPVLNEYWAPKPFRITKETEAIRHIFLSLREIGQTMAVLSYIS